MAGRSPDEIGYVMAHGTGTVYNDRMESIALKRFFNDLPPVSSIKSMIGHTLGAAGALESICAVSALREGVAPPTINYRDPDPECVSDPVANSARRIDLECVLKTASGFGGQNCSMIFERP
jgi:3-oxoacyl-[acyl-carrier-protein] synthase II